MKKNCKTQKCFNHNALQKFNYNEIEIIQFSINSYIDTLTDYTKCIYTIREYFIFRIQNQHQL